MLRITPADIIRNRFGIRAVFANLDTLALFAGSLPKGFRTTVDRLMGRRTRIVRCRYGVLVFLHQPNLATLGWLHRNQDDISFVISRTDIGVGFVTATQHDADNLRNEMGRRARLKNIGFKGPGEPHDGFLVWNRTRSTKNAVAYSDRPCRVSGSPHNSRLELRFTNKAAKRRGLTDIETIASINPQALFRDEMTWHSFTEEQHARALDRWVRKYVQSRRDKFLAANKLYSDEIEAYHERYLRGLARRSGLILTHTTSDAIFDLIPTELSFDYHNPSIAEAMETVVDELFEIREGTLSEGAEGTVSESGNGATLS